jgi:RNA polymerase sigma factor (sigma-70 family)
VRCRRLTDEQRATVERHYGLAVEFGGAWRGTGRLRRGDRISAAAEGLMHAVTKHDPSKGTIGTYAKFWMKTYLVRAEWDESMIRIPGYVAFERKGAKFAGASDRARSTVPLFMGGRHLSGPGDGGSAVDDADEARWLRGLMGELPERTRHIIRRHAMEGMPLSEVAKEIGLTREWASKLYARGLERLRVLFSPHPENYRCTLADSGACE